MRSVIAASVGVALAFVLGSVNEPVRSEGTDGLGVLDVTVDDLLEWTESFRRWGMWEDSGLGAANFITPEKRKKAAKLVKLGLSVSMAHDVDQGPPVLGFPQLPVDPPGANVLIRSLPLTEPVDPVFISDSYAYTGTYHGNTHSHVDSLGCHALFKPPDLSETVGWNGFGGSEVFAADGCPSPEGGVNAMKHGIFTRAILLDIPFLKGKEWLDQGEGIGEFVTGEDIVAFENFAKVKISAGDVVLLYTGRWKREAVEGPWSPFVDGGAGYHSSVIPLLFEREVAYIGSDFVGDAFPTGFGAPFVLPVHQIVMPFLGINILDNLDLELVAEAARELGRWDFLITAGPLRIDQGHGSPLNPIATF
jgi:hypothetical protein